MSERKTEPILETSPRPTRQAHHSGVVSQKGLHGMCRTVPMHTEHRRATRVDSPPESPTESVAGSTGTPANRDVQRSLQTPSGHRRHHVAGSLCLGDAADALSGAQEDPSAPHRDRHGDQSATLYGLVGGGATLENVHITFRPLSTGSVIRQQHHFIITPKSLAGGRYPGRL